MLIVIRLRKRYEKRRPVHRPAMAATQRAREVFAADEGTIGKAPTLVLEKQPQLEGVPQNVLANLLAGKMGCSAAEISARLKLSPDQGSIVLPDTFAALIREREPIQEVIEAHTVGKVRFKWDTTATPRMLAWFPVVEHQLPNKVLFRDHLMALEALAPRESGLGLRADKSMYVQSHNGDLREAAWAPVPGSP